MKIQLTLIIFLISTLPVFSQTITVTGSATFCQGGSVLLTSPVGDSYQWQNNGTNIGGATNQDYTATIGGSYTVIFAIAGVADTTDAVVVTVNPNPVASFVSTTNICSGVGVQFTSTVTNGTGPYNYQWYFGGGGVSTADNPIHTFTSLGCASAVFQDTLDIKDVKGCTARATNPVTIVQAPDAQLTDQDPFTPFSNCDNSPSPANPNFTITVNNSSPGSSMACTLSYTLNWGDGNIESGLTAANFPRTHTYTQVGAFNLSLTAFGTNGCNYTRTYTVANQSNPAGGLTTLGGTTGLCTPSVVRFVIDAWNLNSPGTIYRLNFGDGTSIVLNHPLNTTLLPDTISHTYTNSSCPAPSYTAKLTVRNACDSTTYTASNIQIRKKPEANFSIPVVACTGVNTCFFDATVLGDYGPNCNTLANYTWDFGDPSSGNNTTTVVNPCHNYATPGNYTVTLNTGNPCGISTAVKTVCVTAAPVANFNIDAPAVCTNTVVTASNISTTNTCGATNYAWSVTYTAGFCGTSAGWNFANGTNASSANPSFVFTVPGTYTIKLTISSPCGTTTATKVVKVKKPPTVILPVISDACGPVSICPAPTIINCGETALTYSWLFDGGTAGSSTNANPGCITFSGDGVHSVSVAVTNECGTTTVTRQFTIKPIPDLSIPGSAGYCPEVSTSGFNFSSTTPGAVITWTNNNTSIGLASSGVGNIGSFITVNGTASPITSTITVNASLNGCSKQLSFTITVNPKPLPPAVTSPVNYCKDATAVPLSVTASGGNTILWYTTASGGTGSATAPTPLTNTIGPTNYYASQVNSATGCESNRSLIAVNVYAIAAIGGANATNPTACATSTGTIVLSGLSPSVTYTVHYTAGSTPHTVSITSDASGNLTIAGLTAGLYNNIYVTLNGCSSNPVGPFTLTDPNPPATPVAGANGPICAGQNLTLNSNSATSGVSYTWTGPNSFTSTQQNPIINNATTAASGTYFVTATLNNCQSAPGSVDVLIYATPTVQAAPNTITVCSDDAINLQSVSTFPGTITYAWTGPGGYTSNVQNPVIPNANTTMSGVYTVKVTSSVGSCQSPPANVNVTVNQRPVITNSAFTNPTLCGSATGSITLNGLVASSSYTVRYLKNGTPVTTTIIANASGNVVIAGLPAGTYTDINVTLLGCVSNLVGPFTLVDPNPPASPTATSNGPICQGVSLQLNAGSTAGSTYSWTGPNGFASTQQNPVIDNVTLAANGTYNVFATLNNCNSLPASINVVINPRPGVPTMPANLTFCAVDTIKLTSSSTFAGALTYSWTGPNGFTSTLQNPVIPNASAAMIGVYSLSVTSVQGSCLSPAATTNLSVLPLPVITTTSHINPIGCGTPTGSIILNGLTPSAMYTIYYSLNGGVLVSQNVIANGAGAIITQNLVAGVYTNVTVTQNGCRSNVAGPFLLKDTAPFSVLAENNGPVCENTNLLLTAEITTVGGATIAWNGPNGFTSNIQSPVITNATINNNGIYYVAVTVDGCTSTDSVTVTVSEHSVAGFSGPDATVCRGKNSGIVHLSGNLGQIIRWEQSINNGLTWSPISSSSFLLPYTDLTVTTWYRAFIQNGACPPVYSNITKVNVLNSVQSVSITPDSTGTCVHDTTVLFTAHPVYTGIDPIRYFWYLNGQIQGNSNTLSWHFQLPVADLSTSETIIKVLAENSFGCGDTSLAAKMIIYPFPVITKTKSNDISCYWGTSNLTVTGADNYFWWSSDSSISDPHASSITVSPKKSSTYYLRAVSANGCIKEDSIRVLVDNNIANGQFNVPNAFTPNGDGLNDQFCVSGFTSENFELQIFDRKGGLLFRTTDPSKCWDGTFDGKRQPPAVYVYWLRAKTVCDDKAFKKGWLVLIR